ncbi:hypothetical protein L596_000995 [Steinernema carpocapsae]|uniref:Uncharacterized protein n=1 Tax=Steinernema carpocapsae TaxID=34508 RepID=A0A4V6I6Z6_STECR|nr:hypothetical protein L596_000995 [Steinernema carpocapsae]
MSRGSRDALVPRNSLFRRFAAASFKPWQLCKYNGASFKRFRFLRRNQTFARSAKLRTKIAKANLRSGI